MLRGSSQEEQMDWLLSPVTLTGFNLGPFRTEPLKNITELNFKSSLNCKKPQPKLLSRWEMAEVQRLHPHRENVSMREREMGRGGKQKHSYQIGFSISQRQCYFWQGSIQNTSTNENVWFLALPLPTVCGRETSKSHWMLIKGCPWK